MEPRPPQELENKELTPEEKKIAQSIEKFPFMDRRNKILFMLVWRKLMKAVRLSLDGNSLQEATLNLKDIIKKAELSFNQGSGQKNDFGILEDWKMFFVADTKVNADLFAQLWFRDHKKDIEAYTKMGQMSGFPDTAIETYNKFTRLGEPEREKIRQELVLSEKEKKVMINSELYPLSLLFYMSRDNWQTELQVVHRWVDEIKLVAPDLYDSYKKEIEDHERRNTKIF